MRTLIATLVLIVAGGQKGKGLGRFGDRVGVADGAENGNAFGSHSWGGFGMRKTLEVW